MSQEKEVILRLSNIEKLLTVLVKNQLAREIEKEMEDSKKKKLYELTGKYGVQDIAKKMKCSVGWISGVWKRWDQLGLIIKHGKGYVKIF